LFWILAGNGKSGQWFMGDGKERGAEKALSLFVWGADSAKKA